MRIALAVLFVAVACLTVSTLLWLRATGPGPALTGAAPAAVLAEFERTQRPAHDIAIGARYAGRLDLLDPRLALPTWHERVRDEAVAYYRATRVCPPAAVDPLTDASLAKAYAWHEQTCSDATKPPPDALLDRPPFLHPSGRSYAALAVARGAASRGWIASHARAFHVLELAALDREALDPDDRALAAIPPTAWQAILRGQALALTPSTLIIAQQTATGISSVRIYRRTEWERFGRQRSLALVARAPNGSCANPASAELCLESATVSDRHRRVLVLGTGASAMLVVLSSIFLGVAYIGARRRVHRDRIHVLRTLTHELRTPATSLRLDIEPLRAAYDELPPSCQEPILRISDGIERLHRVLHRSARYMALFEPSGQPLERLLAPQAIDSAKEMFEELRGEWPEEVVLASTSADGPLRTDPEWLGVAVRNLVENGTRHGKPPVTVRWSIEGEILRVRVSDGGQSPTFSLRRAIVPYERDARSPGLGLGLAIVDRVARLLGGRLTHESSPTVFELRLPAKVGRS